MVKSWGKWDDQDWEKHWTAASLEEKVNMVMSRDC